MIIGIAVFSRFIWSAISVPVVLPSWAFWGMRSIVDWHKAIAGERRTNKANAVRLVLNRVGSSRAGKTQYVMSLRNRSLYAVQRGVTQQSRPERPIVCGKTSAPFGRI